MQPSSSASIQPSSPGDAARAQRSALSTQPSTGTQPSIQHSTHGAALRLAATGTETPRLDAEVLMAFVLSWSRARLFAHWEQPLADGDRARFEALVERRAAGEPVAYIRGFKEFLGLDFCVDRRVLIPRPETELLVARAVAWLQAHPEARRVVDVGTGSGAVAVGLLHSCPYLEVLAADVSAAALEVARANFERHAVQPRTAQGSLLEPVEGPVDLVVSNLPYLTPEEHASLAGTSVSFEPPLALLGGDDGLRLFDHLFRQVPAKLAPGGCLLLEIGSPQSRALRHLARERLPDWQATVFADYAGWPRVLQLEGRTTPSMPN